MFLMCRITESKRQQNELNKQKITERELTNLNQKINKLLTKLEEHEQEVATSMEEECVICIHSKASISTFPCGHTVICRRCFVRTIQTSVQQKSLPLRCVICREKILRLKQSFTADLPEPANRKYKRQTRAHQSSAKGKKNETSSYSMSSKSTCKKKIAQQITINHANNSKNTIESVKVENWTENDSTEEANEIKGINVQSMNLGKNTEIRNEFEAEHIGDGIEMNKRTMDDKLRVNANQINTTDLVSDTQIKSPIRRDNLERIEKLKKLTNERPLTVKAKIINYFTRAVRDVKVKKEEINYSVPKKVGNTWVGRLKSKVTNYSNELKALFNF